MSSYSQLFITGGSGFLGWNLAQYAANTYDVYFSYYQNPVKIHGCQEYHLNLQNTDQIEDVLGEIHPEVIFHTAALADVDVCEKRRSMAHDINVRATRHLVQYAEDIGAKFVYISTDLVFDGEKGNYSESESPKPCNYYAETKVQAEKVVKEISSDYLIVRMALMYGNSNGKNPCFTDWLKNELEQHNDVKLFTDQYRSPLYVQDGVRALLELIEQPANNQIFHLAGKERINRFAFGELFTQTFGYHKKYLQPATMKDVYVEARRGGDCSLNIKKIQKLLSFQLSGAKAGLNAMKQEREL